MNLLKLSDLDYRVDKNGVLTIIINKDTIVKASSPEVITICIEIIKRTLGEQLCIPMDIFNQISNALNKKEPEIEVVEDAKKDLTIDIDPIIVTDIGCLSDDEDCLVSFIHQYVNKFSQEYLFNIAEIKQVMGQLSQERMLDLLTEKGYAISFPDNRTVKVQLLNVER